MILAGKDFEVTNSCEEWEWDDMNEVAGEILDDAEKKGKTMVWVSASNVDWRGNNGYRVFDIEEDGYKDFWRKIAGWGDTEWTLRAVEEIKSGENFGMMAYSHDTPTGGLRAVKFLNGEDIYKMVKSTDMKRSEIVERCSGYTYHMDDGRITNKMLFEAIDYAGADLVEELL